MCLLASTLRITNRKADHNYFVHQSPWEAYSLSADQNIICFLWNLLLLCLLRPPLDSVVSRKMQPLYSCLIPLRFTLILFAQLCICLANVLSIHDFHQNMTPLLSIGLKYIIRTLFSLYDPPFNIRWTFKIMNFYMIQFSPLCLCRLLCPNIFHSLQLSIILNIWAI